MSRLLLRGVEVDGAACDVLIADGRVAAIGRDLPRERDEIAGRGGALIPGLVDHHIHLLATAAAAESIDLSACETLDAVAGEIARIAATRPAGSWLRATRCPAPVAERLDRHVLTRIAPAHRLRVLDRTGALWVLNDAALAAAGEIAGLERDSGRLWRGDAALRAAIGTVVPPLAPLGARLAACGVTAVTDASVTTDADAAAILTGAIPQRLTLMSGGALSSPADGAFAVGPVKIVPDERAPPDLDAFIARIADARAWGRAVAVHCVTAFELALTLAAFEAAGTRPGDRIEHGSVIPADAIPVIAALGLTVATQPGFVAARGDAYLRDVAAGEHADLYRCASLIAADVPVLGSSDAPYGPLDPWAAMRAAVTRETAAGVVLGADERIAPAQALRLYTGGTSVRVGMAADLCLLRVGLAATLDALDAQNVAATLIGGRAVHLSI
ncbi:amidohydrolase family protein [Sphingomonas immobilis]|uniref:Amidohydrolase family protein n=1 Tax=Sphingomonas immobilis TaxID=3063997 RepID=A0ABT8ZXH6_9SPHN|nr:amidohydrolase family protein [Sphingomonas sp. CA1-15]MDO7842248.1 amidohydrolase family protein [Sphingomonas sp. CA1-15]